MDVEIGDGYGYGSGYGSGSGYGYGDGSGDGYGYGDGDGSGYGYGDQMVAMQPFVAWHYVADGKTRASLDHPSQAVRPGLVMECNGEPKCCSSIGLHASMTRHEARKYAKPGWVLCRVRCSGLVHWQEDKLACTRREVIEVIGPEYW